MPRIYDSVQTNHPPRNRFDLSHSHFLTARVGLLYPVMCKEMYPGDVFYLKNAVHAELQPMMAPLLSDLTLFAHTFFVPYRLIYGVDHEDGKSIWEKFITGGDDGDYATPLPTWNPSWSKESFSPDTIWDSIGNPVSCEITDAPTEEDPDHKTYTWSPIVPFGLGVSCAPKLSYNLIYNSFFRDENLQDEIDITVNEDLLFADWRKDYFTSALESQQFGTAPALPLSGKLPFSVIDESKGPMIVDLGNLGVRYSPTYSSPKDFLEGWPMESGFPVKVQHSQEQPVSDGFRVRSVLDGADTASVSNIIGGRYGVDISQAVTFNVADMRLVFAMQRLMELTMLSGHRYTEYLHAHFGVSPTDARLDRPEYVGGCQFPISVGVTVQTSASDDTSPQGNKVGIGNINDVMDVGSYRAEEYGLIMTLISIRPKPCYTQGISREWLRQNRFEYYTPEMANLSEQAVYSAEVYVDGLDHTGEADPRNDNTIFGYQAHWNELRASQNFVSGAMREQFNYWLMSRQFGSRPALNADFISLGHPEEYNRIWAVQDEDQFIIAWSNIIDAFRPIPAFGTPGLIDHVYGGL